MSTAGAAHPIPIFIGSGEASRIERQVLIHSLRKHSSQPLDIRVFNGTHNALEIEGRAPELLPLPLALKYRNRATEFSLYRYIIPQLCGYQGQAVWLDSDIVCLADPVRLLNQPMEGADLLARCHTLAGSATPSWWPSVALIDCERARFPLEAIFAAIDAGELSLDDFNRFQPPYLSRFPLHPRALHRRFNEFDRCDADTVFLHYTELTTQPWKFAGHPYGQIWFEALSEALEAGAVSHGDIALNILRGYARPDLLAGNSGLRSLLYHGKRWLRIKLGRQRWFHS